MGCVAGEGLLLDSVLLLITSGGLGLFVFLGLAEPAGVQKQKRRNRDFPTFGLLCNPYKKDYSRLEFKIEAPTFVRPPN